ncbi:aminoacetone oxidase family FAD-binding enzyme [Salipiger sp. PrR002]|uniref:NAD(P)/FAD-dependent oxidoreductase n=1 Tax=Salipiger sp. PrR002 TaxID=2706489 RepID=UPI0013B6FE87|nr:aminoacetone oxidase family FAD-binding enzyme [Salipiger sp. PrR002]NDW02123.1 aminoacetone oxidase family FAD-binding enzyme [Salipiger sp. PrR002]NDW59301.1 aminoacetone oxidase family FAD-binding enzyme [Salipiger sp. PrR004]
MEINTLILGAGAAGMMCAAHAGPGTLVIDHARAPGEKIRISGGGRCNFTNLGTEPSRFLSQNPHFCKSALARYSQWDFIELVSRHGIAWHEKTLGQLFCDGKATQIVAMLLREMEAAGAELWLQTSLRDLTFGDGLYTARVEREGRETVIRARNLVVATGGRSIPKMGATGLAYDIARQFGHALIAPRPGLVPLTFPEGRFADLAGVALPARVTAGGTSFDEALLFTHRGLSGPSILQASSYWHEGEEITVNLSPALDPAAHLRAARKGAGKRALTTELRQILPERLVGHLADHLDLSGNLADLSDKRAAALAEALQAWVLRPSGSEGWRTAEVTLGGVDTDGLNSKTMASKTVPGLHFIGEAVDVTGWLGGYNFQWAWASGAAAGQSIAAG